MSDGHDHNHRLQPFTGLYRAQPVPSTFAFAVRHSGVFWYRGSFSDVDATLTADGDAVALEGSARVDSISVHQPPELRAHLLAADFFAAEAHPRIGFRSTAVRLAQDGQAEVDGELTMRGITRAIAATGYHAPPRPAAFGTVAGLQLLASFDRRAFGFAWQMPLPDGGDAIGWDVEVLIDLLLIRDEEAAA